MEITNQSFFDIVKSGLVSFKTLGLFSLKDSEFIYKVGGVPLHDHWYIVSLGDKVPLFKKVTKDYYNKLDKKTISDSKLYVEGTFEMSKGTLKDAYGKKMVLEKIKYTGFKTTDGQYYVIDSFKDKNELQGGSGSKYTKTSDIYKGRDGISRTIYQKNDAKYVKKKDSKTGKFVYRRIKL